MPVKNDEWTEHHVSGFTFFTGEGFTLLGRYREDLNKAQERWREARRKAPDVVRWRWERGANHVHPAPMSLGARELVFKEWVYASQLSAALRQVFPARPFIVSWIPGYAVSFYSWEDGATGPGVTILREPEETVVCVTCQDWRAYTLTANPDPDIPELRWARCAVCTTDCLLGDYEICKRIAPDTPTWHTATL